MSTKLPPLPLAVAIVDENGRMTPQFAKWLSESLITRVGGTEQLSNTELATETSNLNIATGGLQSTLTALSSTVDGLLLESAATSSAPVEIPPSVLEDPNARIQQLEAVVASLSNEIDSIKKGTVIL